MQKTASVAEVDDSAGAAVYIDSCVNTQPHYVRKHTMSAGWVFPGWVSWSGWFEDSYAVYPDQKYPGILGKLARI